MLRPLEALRPLVLGAPTPSAPSVPSAAAAPTAAAGPRLTTAELSGLRYDVGEESLVARFLVDDREVAALTVNFVDLSFYAKQQLLKKPGLLECGVVLAGHVVEKFLIPTGRSRTARNGSIAVKCYDVAKPVEDGALERYERVGIRPPSGDFTYAFFEAQYLTRAEDPRKGALFLIDPRMIVLQYPMSEAQRQEFQTFGGKKVLYFDVLEAPNVKEREEEIKRCRVRGDELKKQHEAADRKWEEDLAERMRQKAAEEAEKPKVSKKAKQKARKAAKAADKGPGAPEEDAEESLAAAEDERLHKQMQADSKAKAEEDARRGRELEAERRRLEAAEAKRLQEADEARMRRVKDLLQKVQSKLHCADATGYPASTG